MTRCFLPLDCIHKIFHSSRCLPVLTNVLSVDGSGGGLETQTDVLVPPPLTGDLSERLWVEEDLLLLESLLGLSVEYGGHDGRSVVEGKRRM